MGSLKLFSIALTVLLASLCVNSTVTANSLMLNSPNVLIEEVDGGPRNVIQFMNSVTVIQQEPELITITILGVSGRVVFETETAELETTISTDSFEPGVYELEIVDSEGRYEQFYITVD